MWILQTVSYTRLCSEVAYFVEFFAFKKCIELFAVFEVHAHKTVIFVFSALHRGVPVFCFAIYSCFFKAGIFQVNIVVIVDVVDANDSVTPFK